jgi:hypothetical protein
MPVAESIKCRCLEPDPVGPWVLGLRKCAKCGKVANWREFEEACTVGELLTAVVESNESDKEVQEPGGQDNGIKTI